MSETGIMIAGSGGQGILFLGKLVAQSAMMSGKHVTWFPSYGAEVRGGTANCTVLVSDEMIGSPVIRNPDVLVVMNESSERRFEQRLKPGGLLIMDSSLVKNEPIRADIRVLKVPATEIAASVGSTKSSNMVMLGAMLSEGLLDERSSLSALDELTPNSKKSSLALNKKALIEGKQYGGHKKS